MKCAICTYEFDITSGGTLLRHFCIVHCCVQHKMPPAVLYVPCIAVYCNTRVSTSVYVEMNGENLTAAEIMQGKWLSVFVSRNKPGRSTKSVKGETLPSLHVVLFQGGKQRTVYGVDRLVAYSYLVTSGQHTQDQFTMATMLLLANHRSLFGLCYANTNRRALHVSPVAYFCTCISHLLACFKLTCFNSAKFNFSLVW